jgi:hypothetical protein
MRVSDSFYALDMKVECRGTECTGELKSKSESEQIFRYKVPESNDIKICIKNTGLKTIHLTANTKSMTWVLLTDESLNTVFSQEKGETGIAFGNGHWNIILEFVH